MSRIDHVRLMATYNEWMNKKLYECTLVLTDEQIAKDQQAFFSSILGTLNHLLVADTIWLKRIAAHSSRYPQLDPLSGHVTPTALDQILYNNIRTLWSHRKVLDEIIVQWARAITEADLDQLLHYKNMKGMPSARNFFSVIMHIFNHQTHHRGQTTTLINRYGVDVGVTDLLMVIPDHIEH